MTEDKRQVWDLAYTDDNQITVIWTEELLSIEIDEEQAVSSYNAMVTTSIRLDKGDAKALRDFLVALRLDR